MLVRQLPGGWHTAGLYGIEGQGSGRFGCFKSGKIRSLTIGFVTRRAL